MFINKIISVIESKYKSLCSLCELPGQCSSSDKYWGRQGALFCLSDCLGDVAWSRLDDALYHFKVRIMLNIMQ